MLKYTKLGANRLDLNDNEVVAVKGNERYHLRLITKELSEIGDTYSRTTSNIQSTFNDINRSRVAMINHYEEELVKRTEEKTDLELEIFKLKKELQRKQDIIASQELEIRRVIREQSVVQMEALREKDEEILALMRKIKLLAEELREMRKEKAIRVPVARKDASTGMNYDKMALLTHSSSLQIYVKPRNYINMVTIKLEPREEPISVKGVGRHVTTKEFFISDLYEVTPWPRTCVC